VTVGSFVKVTPLAERVPRVSELGTPLGTPLGRVSVGVTVLSGSERTVGRAVAVVRSASAVTSKAVLSRLPKSIWLKPRKKLPFWELAAWSMS